MKLIHALMWGLVVLAAAASYDVFYGNGPFTMENRIEDHLYNIKYGVPLDRYEAINAVWMYHEFDPQIITHLIWALKDEDEDVQIAAIRGLMGINDSKSLVPLVKTLENGNPDVIKEAAYAIAYITKMTDDKCAVYHLCNCLDSDNLEARAYAADVLGKIGDPRAVSDLIRTLRDEEVWVRYNAALALGEIGDPRAIDPLTEVSRNDEDGSVRHIAYLALAKINAKQQGQGEGGW